MAQRGNQVQLERRIPRSLASIVARLTQDRPDILTRADIATYLEATSSDGEVEATLRQLQSLGWVASTPRHGVWAFVAPGEIQPRDPFIDLRAWQASDPTAVFALAGEAVAWRLGYLARQYNGPTSIWVPHGTIVPSGIRRTVSTITLGWGPDKAAVLGPDRAWLRKRKLDLLRWSSGLPALGPEALLVQLSARPTSFHPWADLAPNLTSLAESCGAPRLLDLLDNHKTTVYQRAAYLLDTGGNPSAADQVLAGRPSRSLSHVVLGAGPDSVFSAKHRLTDRLVAPFLTQYGKA